MLTMSAPNCLNWKVPVKFYQGDSLCRLGWMAGLCIALTVLLAHLSHASEWYTVDSTTDGIQILRKKVDDGTLVAFRGIGIIEAPLPLVATVIFDANRRLEWIEGLDDSKIIRWGDEDSFIEYDHIDMPIFMKDRDFVSKIIMSFDLSKKEMIFHYQPSDDPTAPRTNYIRGELIDATFILSSIDNDKKTKVDASFLCDPKGSIPKWLVNFFLKDWPKTTFRNLRKEVLKPDIAVDTRFARLLKR
jgi:hypothetical protein